jgi:hypothetical protein
MLLAYLLAMVGVLSRWDEREKKNCVDLLLLKDG